MKTQSIIHRLFQALRRMLFYFPALVLLIAPGCRDTEQRAEKQRSETRGTEKHSTDKPSAEKPGHGGDFFSSPRVLEIVLEISPSELETLKNNKDSHDYVHCTVREGGATYKDVGVHCRGNPADELATGKPDLIVTFDKFVSGQKFRGVRRLTFQAGKEDPSYLGAPLAFEMFREAGVPAPRCGFARVELNGRPLGLYVLMEAVDRAFLRQHFRNIKGSLYDEGDRTDVTGKLDKDRGEDLDDQSDIDALAAAALQTDPEVRWKQVQQRIDMDRFLAFTALEVLLWQKDSYAMHGRKFRIYHDPDTARLVFFPKGVESVLEKTDGPIMPKCKGVVAKAVLTTPEGEKQYRQTVAKLLHTVFNPAKVQARSKELAAAIKPAVAGNNAEAAKAFDAAVASYCDAVSRRASFAAQQLKSPQAN